MSGDLIPEEAAEAFEDARARALAGPTASLANYRGLQAAAPLILAVELADVVRDLEALHADGGEIDDLTEKWRRRASALLSDGQPEASRCGTARATVMPDGLAAEPIDVVDSLRPVGPLRAALDAYSVVRAEREERGGRFTHGDHQRGMRAALEAAAPLILAIGFERVVAQLQPEEPDPDADEPDARCTEAMDNIAGRLRQAISALRGMQGVRDV